MGNPKEKTKKPGKIIHKHQGNTHLLRAYTIKNKQQDFARKVGVGVLMCLKYLPGRKLT